VQQVGQQAGNVGRMAVLAAGWPESVPGTTVDRQCGSSQQTIHFAAAGLVSGQYDVAIAGGVEMMSAVPLGAMAMFKDLGRPGGQKVRERYGVTFNQGIGAEMMAEKWGLSRDRLDEFSSASHAKLAAATDEGRLAGQIAPVELPATSARSRSTRRLPRCRWPGWPRPAPIRPGSTRAAGPSP